MVFGDFFLGGFWILGFGEVGDVDWWRGGDEVVNELLVMRLVVGCWRSC